MAHTIQDSGTQPAKVPDWNVLPDVVYIHARDGMPGGGIDLAHCYRFADQFCADSGIGFFGTSSSGPVEHNFESMRVPNFQIGATYFANEEFGIGLRSRLGYALIRGEADARLDVYSERGLYWDGAARLIGNISMHKVMGAGIHADLGIASVPAAGRLDRSAGLLFRAGFFARF